MHLWHYHYAFSKEHKLFPNNTQFLLCAAVTKPGFILIRELFAREWIHGLLYFKHLCIYCHNITFSLHNPRLLCPYCEKPLSTYALVHVTEQPYTIKEFAE